MFVNQQCSGTKPVAKWRQWTKLKQWRKHLPHLGKAGLAATVLSSSQRVWRTCDLPCSALWLLLCLFCQGKCQILSLPAVSLPTGLLGSMSSSTYRGESGKEADLNQL